MLDPIQCRQRQQRLLAAMAAGGLDAIVVGSAAHVYYLSGHWTSWLEQSGFTLFSDGRSFLVATKPSCENPAADQVVQYESRFLSTLRNDQPAVVATLLEEFLGTPSPAHIGIDASAVSAELLHQGARRTELIDSMLMQLRRVKHADELELIQTAVNCTARMFDAARQMIQPGLPELDLFAEMHAVAVKTLGEPMTALLGNDFACGPAGGAPRKDRRAQAGEIYVLDLGPCYRGYFGDTCRAFSVDRLPTDAQHCAHEAVVGALTLFETLAKPGVRCQDLFAAVDSHMKTLRGTGLSHHLGHGIGLFPHEYPHLNPHWDDVLAEGEIIAVEPGVYGPELAGGVRLENDYLVTATGVRNLLDAPLRL